MGRGSMQTKENYKVGKIYLKIEEEKDCIHKIEKIYIYILFNYVFHQFIGCGPGEC